MIFILFTLKQNIYKIFILNVNFENKNMQIIFKSINMNYVTV